MRAAAQLGVDPARAAQTVSASPPLWQAQCDAALDIAKRFGTRRALGYLVGEKLLAHLENADRDSLAAAELPAFVDRIRRDFSRADLSDYFASVRRVGPLGHALGEAGYEALREAGAIDEDVVRGAEEVLWVERARELLVGE